MASTSQLYYVNVPRLAILSAIQGFELELSFLDNYKSLHSIGGKLYELLLALEKVLNRIELNAFNIQDILLDSDYIGLTLFFNDNFRTKNILDLNNYTSKNSVLIGDINKDPYIYHKYNDFTLHLSIDPRWITTTTAFANFRPSGGIGRFAGFCTIKQVDIENKVIFATPLIIGIPKSPFEGKE